MKQIGFIGIGLMGFPMAKNLLRSGCKLNVFNRSIHKANSLKEFGAEISESVVKLVKNSEVIITMLTDDAAVDQVIGDTDFIDNLMPGTTIIDMSSVKPETAIKHANNLKKKQNIEK